MAKRNRKAEIVEKQGKKQEENKPHPTKEDEEEGNWSLQNVSTYCMYLLTCCYLLT